MMKYLLLILPVIMCFASARAAEKSAVLAHYEPPRIENLSKLYWALSFLDANNDTHIDNFVIINKCNVYQEFFHNEFKWQEIRELTRSQVKNDVGGFPVHFEFAQPLRLGQYDLKTQSFEVLDKYKIQPTTRFEFYSNNIDEVICDQNHAGRPIELEGYPRILIVDLSQPFSLFAIKVQPETAETYINQKMIPFNALKPKNQTPDRLYDLRNAYIVMQIHMIAPKAAEYIYGNEGTRKAAQILGVLDGIKVFADPELTVLLHEERFQR
ncbi:MAG: DUF4852 domain-containing protein [Alphaproteobacteria bacterium]